MIEVWSSRAAVSKIELCRGSRSKADCTLTVAGKYRYVPPVSGLEARMKAMTYFDDGLVLCVEASGDGVRPNAFL